MTDTELLTEINEFVADISAFYVDKAYRDTPLDDLKKYMINRTLEFYETMRKFNK